MVENLVQLGDYIVVQRQNYTKLHKVSARESMMLGKDHIDIGAVIGKPAWTTYKMIPKKNAKRAFVLEECSKSESLAEQLFKDVSSGSDNRNIFDDGRSQALSTEEIVELRSSGLSGQEIVGQLIENSKTFRDKTEYSQEKYLKKKEKKYFEYVTVRWPTIRLISEIMYRVDAPKIMGLRMDTLSQILTTVGMHAHGTYIVYESGCQALVVAAMLNNIREGGNLIHIHPGNFAQKNAVSAMNFCEMHLSCLLQVNVYSLLRKLLQGDDVETKIPSAKANSLESVTENQDTTEMETDSIVIENSESTIDSVSVKPQIKPDNLITSATKIENKNEVIDNTTVCNETELCENKKKQNFENDITDSHVSNIPTSETTNQNENGMSVDDAECIKNEKKRKLPLNDESESKKPRWELDVEKAADILRSSQADGLVLVAREHPTNILTALLPYVAPSRPFVVFCPCREPLLDLYVQLKSRSNTVALRVTETWLRKHQILPSRTHPDILMSGGGGYLLTGIVVENGSMRSDRE